MDEATQIDVQPVEEAPEKTILEARLDREAKEQFDKELDEFKEFVDTHPFVGRLKFVLAIDDAKETETKEYDLKEIFEVPGALAQNMDEVYEDRVLTLVEDYKVQITWTLPKQVEEMQYLKHDVQEVVENTSYRIDGVVEFFPTIGQGVIIATGETYDTEDMIDCIRQYEEKQKAAKV